MKILNNNGLNSFSDKGLLESLLCFVTGMKSVPPLGFVPEPSISFRHEEDLTDDCTKDFPFANTCANELRLPVMFDYELFSRNMISALTAVTTFSAI